MTEKRYRKFIINIQKIHISDDFVNGKIEINDVISKYKINYFIFVKFIKRYCAYYKIIIDDKLQARLNIPLKEMYELKKRMHAI